MSEVEDVVKSLDDISKDLNGGYDPILEKFMNELEEDDTLPSLLAPVNAKTGRPAGSAPRR